VWWILSSCLIASPQNQSCAIIHNNNCSSFVYNGNISHNLLARPKSHDPLVVHLSHLFQYSKKFYKLRKVFKKMLGFFCNPLNQHQKTYIWRDVLWIVVIVILQTFIHPKVSETLIIFRVTNVVKWRFLRSLMVQERCT